MKLQTLKSTLPVLGHTTERTYDRMRGSAASRGYGRRWQHEREAWLREHPLCQCEDCDDGRKRVTAATVVDHRIPHRGDPVLFWDKGNWQSMAAACHNHKTAREDGGFGNQPTERRVGGSNA